MTKKEWKDHFSAQSSSYAAYRPHYPEALFEYLASAVAEKDLAWDCATGNGQAALALTKFFRQVIATDASENQLAYAPYHPKITYRIAPAESTEIQSKSVNLITVAQALHWFNLDKFYEEVNRVLKSSGVLAIWFYDFIRCPGPVQQVISYLQEEVLRDFWPQELDLFVNGNFRTLPFPFEELEPLAFTMEAKLTLTEVLGHLRSWSAVPRYIAAGCLDPLQANQEQFLEAWGSPDERTNMHWPFYLRVGRKRDAH